ncbi:septal ring lytic transglycosylase RlpA family lipoprotein [Bordetella genomosp. 9]|uniref:Endolytic peptidoglycan transglycosylase RlpA n=1 Tax=Bordetella genomosp. 9 TaxID=1416803 RepID=A0A261RM92_9BORD|nr:septal ring lytic transglycosylase RlpA family protein [Bordetella genomosp. 9]OZI25907.1 septal ring lytic transglycosylase RlpA family lipoprotein [Bordetella genomosp. 9]
MTFRHLRNLLVIALLAAVVAGCSSTGGRKRGGYYQDDGPDANPPGNLAAVPDAEPRIEPLASGANKPYVVFGKRYVPMTGDQPYTQRGIASWYGKKFHGNSTSIGEPYDMYAMTAAHPTLPIPSYARVTSAINGKTIIVRVNDRGPFHDNRIMDLSYVAAYKLGIIGPGSGEVTVQRILPDEVRRMVAERESGRRAGAAAAVAVGGAGAGVAGGAGSTAGGGAEPGALTGSDVSVPVPVVLSAGETPTAMPLPSAPSAPVGGTAMNGLPPGRGGVASGPTPLPPAATAAAPVIASPAAAQGPAGSGSVYLQLGAFSQPANAQSLAARVNGPLTAAGLPPATVEQAGQLYRVRVGPYADRNAAMSAVPTVSSSTGISPTIATR